MLSAIAFMIINCAGYILALSKGPFWAIIIYANIYFNAPIRLVNWWAAHLPFHRWSLLTSLILFISLFLHRNKVSSRKLASIKWLFIFTLISILISFTYAPFPDVAKEYTYKLVTYCITAYFLARSITNIQQYRFFCLFFIALVSNISLNAYLYGNRINDRLEGAGIADAFGSNEFALLLVNVIPFTIPFLIHGKLYEKIICIIGLPFLINAFVLCNSRGMSVAFILAVILVSFILPDKVIRRYIFLLILVSIPTLIYLSDAQFIERMESLLQTSDAMSDDAASAQLSSGRTVIGGYGFNMAKDNLLGAGPNSFKSLAHLYMPPEVLTITPRNKQGVRSAHNTYLQVLVEQGIIGLFILLSAMIHTILLLRSSIKKIQETHSTNSFLGLSVLALSLSLLASLFGGLTSSRIYYEFFWWQIALSVVLHSLVIKSSSSNPDDT